MLHLDTITPTPPFPFRKDSVVVLGTIVSRQSDLSQDGTTVYTFYTVRLEQALVCPAACSGIRASSTITLLVEGGAVKLPK